MDNNLFNVANYIISKCDNITNMKLQKLVYYSHIQFLITQNEPLINSNIEAWVYGPVIRELYQEFSRFSYKNITTQSTLGNIANLTENQKKAIDDILILYKDKSNEELSNKTHSEDPWQDAYQSSDWSENIISNESLLKYYKNIV